MLPKSRYFVYTSASTSELLPTFKNPTSEIQKVWPLPATLPRLLRKSCDRHGCRIQLQEIFLWPGEALIEIMSNKTGGDPFSNYSIWQSMQSMYMFLIPAILCNLHVVWCIFGIIDYNKSIEFWVLSHHWDKGRPWVFPPAGVEASLLGRSWIPSLRLLYVTQKSENLIPKCGICGWVDVIYVGRLVSFW